MTVCQKSKGEAAKSCNLQEGFPKDGYAKPQANALFRDGCFFLIPTLCLGQKTRGSLSSLRGLGKLCSLRGAVPGSLSGFQLSAKKNTEAVN